MHILIDGYNVIRQSVRLRRFERKSLEEGRHALIEWLAQYRLIKKHDITVVFDGWINGPAEEERDFSRGVSIVYSGRGIKADDVLKRMTSAAEEEILVVSSDREISSHAKRKGKACLSALEFEAILDRLLKFPAYESEQDEKGEDEEEPHRKTEKKGPSHRLSRAQRLARSKIGKL